MAARTARRPESFAADRPPLGRIDDAAASPAPATGLPTMQRAPIPVLFIGAEVRVEPEPGQGRKRLSVHRKM